MKKKLILGLSGRSKAKFRANHAEGKMFAERETKKFEQSLSVVKLCFSLMLTSCVEQAQSVRLPSDHHGDGIVVKYRRYIFGRKFIGRVRNQ